MSKFLGSNGAELVELIQDTEPDFSIKGMLVDHVLMYPYMAEEIEAEVEKVEIHTSEDGTASICSPVNPGHETVMNIHKRLFGNTIHVQRNMADAFANAFTKDPILNIKDKEQALKSGIRAAGVFELGRFVGQQVFQRIMQGFRTTGLNIPSSQEEAQEFMHDLSSEFYIRLHENSLGDLTLDERALNNYGRRVRPERFASRFGLEMLGFVTNAIDPDKLYHEYQRRAFDDYLGVTTEHIAEIQLEECGALLPMAKERYKLLTEWVHDPMPDGVIFLPEDL